MEITQTEVENATGRDPILHPAVRERLVFDRPVINERSAKFKKTTLPDIAPSAARVKQARTALQNAISKIEELRAKHDRLSKTLQHHTLLSEQRNSLKARIRDIQSRALLAEKEIDLSKDLKHLDEIETQLRVTTSSIDAVKGAKAMVENELRKLDQGLEDLKKSLSSATTQWLRAYHVRALEEIRAALHNLYVPLAKAIAIEQDRDFVQWGDTAWGLVEMIGEGIRYSSDLRPDWTNSVRPSVFTGFAEAREALEVTKAVIDTDEP